MFDNAGVLHGLSLPKPHHFVTCDKKWHACCEVPTVWSAATSKR